MNLSKIIGGIIAIFVFLVSAQAATACVGTINPIDPYTGLWQVNIDECAFNYAIYSPVENGIMTVAPASGFGGDTYEIPIDVKTYPNFTELATPSKIEISFTVDGDPVDYTFYDGGWYTGLQLLNDDHTEKFGLVKIRCADPAPVPIPGAVWLLGAGLVGLAAFRKK